MIRAAEGRYRSSRASHLLVACGAVSGNRRKARSCTVKTTGLRVGGGTKFGANTRSSPPVHSTLGSSQRWERISNTRAGMGDERSRALPETMPNERPGLRDRRPFRYHAMNVSCGSTIGSRRSSCRVYSPIPERPGETAGRASTKIRIDADCSA